MSTIKGENRLARETSPYLRQHASNPVDWYPWGAEALERARAEGRPIFLSIGYSSCHWCHVMERESFEDERIAALMNERFVNIKVDREERPDLDEIYMAATQMLTGQGGWPNSVFLTPDLKPFFAGTYFPPASRGGRPGFADVLRAVSEAYGSKKDDVKRMADEVAGQIARLSEMAASNEVMTIALLNRAFGELAGRFDNAEGGFGGAPKFPHSMDVSFLLRYHRRTRNPEALRMAVLSLEKMARGGMCDQVGGGFHRYSVDAKWLVPHFEKMLYDNAQLLRIYSQAYMITQEPLFKSVVEETVGYLLREMLHSEGGFYSTQDADSEGEEGKFFVWTTEEINRLIGAENGDIFCRIYDVSDQGNFEEKNILHPILTIEQASKLFRKDRSEIDALVADAKQKLFTEREKRIKPFRDEKIIAAWNGLALSGLAEAIKVFNSTVCIEAVNRTIEFIFNKMFRDGFLLHTYKDGQAKLLGYLDDYASVAIGLLDVYEATFERSALDRSIQLTDIMVREFWDEKDGGFFYTGTSHEPLISRTKPAFDGSVPSGNAMATQLLLRLLHITGNDDYRKRAEKVLRCHYEAMESQPFGFAHMLCALDFYLNRPKEIVLVGKNSDLETRALVQEIHKLYLPNRVLQLVDPNQSLERISPLLQGKSQIDGKPTAYVCYDFTCSAPVTSWSELKPLLES